MGKQTKVRIYPQEIMTFLRIKSFMWGREVSLLQEKYNDSFFMTWLSSISVMSVASSSEHLSVMTNAQDFDNGHHNDL